MAANYWDSTQAKYWTFTKSELSALRTDLRHQNEHLYSKYPLPDRRLVVIFLQQNLVKLARRMSIRQQAIATAQAYMKRFYLRVEIRKVNPYLIMTTAIYLACKMEESPQHIRLMLGEAARQWTELNVQESSKIGECEFAMISTLESRLIVHHPYRSLSELAPLFGLSHEEVSLAHNIVNDSYNTDLSLLYPPHVIAITAIFLAVILKPTGQPSGLQNYATSSTNPHAATALPSPGGLHSMSPTSAGLSGNFPALSSNAAQQAYLSSMSGFKQAGPKLGKLVEWLAESKVDMGAIIDATQEMVSLYEVWEQFNERVCRDMINKFAQQNTNK